MRTYKTHVHLLKFLLQRLGHDATIDLWQNALMDYDDTFLKKILSSGWTKTDGAKPEHIEKEITTLLENQFKATVERMNGEQARELVDRTPPTPHIRKTFPSPNMVRATTTYEALHIAFDMLAILIESLLDVYEKEGELIAYDFLSQRRASIAQDKPVSFAEFVAEAQSFLTSPTPNIFTAGQDAKVVTASETEFVVHIEHCEWARYFQERHRRIGYLVACSTDEVFARACNEKIRMQRTSTIMEGGKRCDFRYYLAE